MDSRQILITGATGKTGSRIAQLLEQQGHQVRRGSRNGSPQFDWRNSLTWSEVLDDVRAVYLCYYPDFAFPYALETVEHFVESAKSAGVERLVMITGRGEQYARIAESSVLSSGLPSTILRSAWFAQNFSEGSLFPSVMSGIIPLPGENVGEPFIDISDFAEVAAKVLTESGHEGKTYELTGPDVLSFSEVAEALSVELRRKIAYVPISFEDFQAELEKETDAVYAKIVTQITRETFDGRNAYVSGDVHRILNRSPKSFAEFVSKTAKSGAWNSVA